MDDGQRQCKNCLFFSALKGECHRHPPLSTMYNDAVYPKVRVNDWCGEFKNEESFVKIETIHKDNKRKQK